MLLENGQSKTIICRVLMWWTSKVVEKDFQQDVFVKHKCPPIMANSNEGQDHKDKYFDTSRKILSQEMTMFNMEALVSYL